MIKSVVVFAGLWCIALQVGAQYKNIKLDEGELQQQLADPTIVINSRNQKNIAATTMSGRMAYTIDGGVTWQKSSLTSSTSSGGIQTLISDDKGTLFLFHTSASMDQIICQESKDGGKTWDEGVGIGANPPKHQVSPSVTVDTKNNLVLTWTQFDKYQSADGTCQSFIMMSTSGNGKKWSKPVQVSQTPGNCMDDGKSAGGSIAAVGPDGKSFVTWANNEKIYMDRSFSMGMWLENDFPIGNQPGGWKEKIPGHEQINGVPVLMVDQSKGTYHGCLYLIWADKQKGENDSDVWFMRSNNHGDNWSAAASLGNAAGTHQYAPRMTVDKSTGFIYIIFFDRSNYGDSQTDVYLAYSADSGGSFKSVKISESPFTPNDKGLSGQFTNISAHNGVITPIWSRMDDSVTSVWTAVITQEELIKPAEPAKGKKKK